MSWITGNCWVWFPSQLSVLAGFLPWTRFCVPARLGLSRQVWWHCSSPRGFLSWQQLLPWQLPYTMVSRITLNKGL